MKSTNRLNALIVIRDDEARKVFESKAKVFGPPQSTLQSILSDITIEGSSPSISNSATELQINRTGAPTLEELLTNSNPSTGSNSSQIQNRSSNGFDGEVDSLTAVLPVAPIVPTPTVQLNTGEVKLSNNSDNVGSTREQESSEDVNSNQSSIVSNVNDQSLGETEETDASPTDPNNQNSESESQQVNEDASPFSRLKRLFRGKSSSTNGSNDSGEESAQNQSHELNSETEQPRVSDSSQVNSSSSGNQDDKSNSDKNKGKDPNKNRTSMFSNERSTTYRRDFIKANPPFKIPFFGEYYMCNLCFKLVKIEDMQVDHVYPVSKGGSNGTGNLAPLCQPCNLDKSNKRDSRILQIYAVKYGGKAIGVPVSLVIRGGTFTVKSAGKAAFVIGKWGLSSLLSIVPKLFGKFMQMSLKSKLVVVGVGVFGYYYLL